MIQYYVYIMASPSGTLYVGITNNLQQRVYEHKHGLIQGFTKKYNVTRLVYFEETGDVQSAIA
jgi:putative endonuclease